MSELTDGVGNDMEHRLRSSNEVYRAYCRAVDGIAGVTGIAELQVLQVLLYCRCTSFTELQVLQVLLKCRCYKYF